jgi:hypothetical protein
MEKEEGVNTCIGADETLIRKEGKEKRVGRG